jgi:hypothetical protein
VLYSERVRKKKGFTDLVAIIPFSGQVSKEELVSKMLPPPQVDIEPVLPEKPEAKILSVPAGILNTGHLSIKKMTEPLLTEKASQGQDNDTARRKENFNVDQVKMAWKRYAHEVDAKGMTTFYNAMIKRDPTIKEEVLIVMEVDNQVQIDYITPHLQDLNTFLRQELKNYEVTVDFFLSDNKESEVKFLTGKDRFASMAKKNPNLHSFKTIFNLDIEF